MARPSPITSLVAVGVLASGLAVAPALAGGGDTDVATAAATPLEATAATPVLSARRLPELLVTPAADRRLSASLEDALDELPETSCAAVRDGERTVLDVRADEPVTPASTMKLLTALAVLEEIDPATTFVTRAVTDAEAEGGVVDGDLWLVGGGDPVLQTPGYEITWEDPEHPPPHTDLSDLADALADAGITRVTGRVVGDDTRYDDERYPATWPKRYLSGGESGPTLGPERQRRVHRPRGRPRHPPVRREAGRPPGARGAADARRCSPTGGSPSTGAPPRAWPPMTRCSWPSTPRRRPSSRSSGRPSPTPTTPAPSLPLKGPRTRLRRWGSSAAGARAVTEVLAELRLPTRDLTVVDGSGLDPTNRVTCALLVGVLEEAGPGGPLADGLAVTGEQGTLRRRLRGTDAVGNLRGKTGTLAGVSALAGWVDDAEGRPVAFALVTNGEAPTAQTAQDQLVLALLDYPERPPVDDLGPR